MTTAIPTHTAKFIAERMRQDLEHAAEKAADYRMEAHALRKRAAAIASPELRYGALEQADLLDTKAERWDAEFKVLENVCMALTKAGV